MDGDLTADAHLNVDVRMNADEHLKKIIAIHFDPDTGTPYWLERQQAIGIDVRQKIVRLADLEKLGPMDENALRHRPMLDFVPISRRDRLAGAIVAETSGTTGEPKRTIFTPDEFHAAFVEPFVLVAKRTGFPHRVLENRSQEPSRDSKGAILDPETRSLPYGRGSDKASHTPSQGALWLWAGPSGPHVIGQAAAACAAAMGSPQPLCVDFDPRWFRKLPQDSMARDRYFNHIIEQAMTIIRREPIGVIFTTPVVLQRLAKTMTAQQRLRVGGVHYGGMRVTRELLKQASLDWFPRAVHLSGYGNSLFGVCMELGGPPDRVLRYHPCGPRLHVRVAADHRIWMSRLDETVLIANLQERDIADPAPAPSQEPWPGFGPGIEDPRPPATNSPNKNLGIY